MTDEELITLITEDLVAWFDAERPTDALHPLLTAYQSALATVVFLRQSMIQRPDLPSMTAIVMERESELLLYAALVQDLRHALHRVLDDVSSGQGSLPEGTVSMCETAIH